MKDTNYTIEGVMRGFFDATSFATLQSIEPVSATQARVASANDVDSQVNWIVKGY